MGHVRLERHPASLNDVVEAGPAGAGVVLGGGGEQVLSTDDAPVDARLTVLVEPARKRSAGETGGEGWGSWRPDRGSVARGHAQCQISAIRLCGSS